MIVDRYYYHQLNKQEQAIYRAFYKGVMEHLDIIPIPAGAVFTEKVFGRIFEAMSKDNPLIYFLNQSTCSCAQDRFGNIAICPQYFLGYEKVREYNRKLEKVVNHLAGKLKLTEGSDYEKVRKVHDWICQNISYDEDGTDQSKLIRVIASHNILGVFAYRKAQCEGIAKAVKVLLNAVDVKCIVVTGNSYKNDEKVPHAWNLVKIDRQPYHLDITWDMDMSGLSSKKTIYDYFNLSDKMIAKDHTADSLLPECSSMKDNYFTVNKMTFRTIRPLLSYMKRELKTGNSEFYFRIEKVVSASEILAEIEKVVSGVFSEQGVSEKKVRLIRVNDKIGTYWVKIEDRQSGN